MKLGSASMTLACVFAAACTARSNVPNGPSGGAAGAFTVIRGGTLIDGTGRPPLADAVVLVQGDRIAAVGDSNAVATPRGARVIDAHGRFLVPGLIDCHCHMEGIGLGDLADLPPE